MGMTDAMLAARRAEEEARERAQERARLRAPIELIDELVDRIEQDNLDRQREIAPQLWEDLLRLPEMMARPLPAPVLHAMNTAHLHAALLDWQAEMLDAAVPQRALYPND